MKWNGRNYRPAGQYIRHSKNNKEFNFEDALKPLGEKENKGNVWVPVKQVIMNVPQTTSSVPTTPTPTPSLSPSPSLTPTQTQTGTPAVTSTPTTTPSGTPAITTTPTNTPTNTQTGTPSITSTPTPTPSPVVLLLDTYPALAAYSTRKLRTAYSGSCIRVRRETDNVEQDIGFVSNKLDTASLSSFLGSTTGSVVKWYNQGTGGTTNDLIQSTAATQPKITNSSGVIYTAGTGNNPVIFFNGGNNIAISGTTDFGAQNNASVFVVSQRTGGGTGAAIVAQGSSNYKLNFYQQQCQFDTGGGNVVGSYSGVFSALTQGTFIRGNANKAFIKKVQSSTTNNTAASNLSTINVMLGNRFGNDLPLTGYIGEVIIYSSNQESNITPISDSQINYYGV